MVTQQIGLTGGIGSGKTTVSRIFALLGVPVYYADLRAKALQEEDDTVRQAVQTAFGQAMYRPSGQLNRQKLAQKVFSDEDALKKLNAIVHPAVEKDYQQWVKHRQDTPYVLKEAALLFESGSNRALDTIITVTAPEALRIARICKRDGVDESAVRARMQHQLPEAEKRRYADYCIYNDEDHLIIPQVLHIHKKLCRKH